MQIPINWLAVLVVSLYGLIIPAIWYAPKVFGETWISLSGLTPEQAGGDWRPIAAAALSSVVTCWGLAGFLFYLRSQTFMEGMLAGAQFWLAFTFAQILVDYRFAHRPWKLVFINTGHSILSMSLAAGTLAVWK